MRLFRTKGIKDMFRAGGRHRRKRQKSVARTPASSRRWLLITAGASFVVLFVVATVAMIWAGISEVARAEATARAESAETRFESSRAFQEWVADDLQAQISDLPGSTGLTRELVARTVARLDAVRPHCEESAELLLTLARSYQSAAVIEASPSIADAKRALVTIQKSIDILEDLKSRAPRDTTVALRLVDAQTRRAEFLWETNDRKEIPGIIESVRSEAAWLVDEESVAKDAWRIRARCAHMSARLRAQDGQIQLAIAGLSHARELLPAVEPGAAVDVWREHIAWDLERLDMLWTQGEKEAARTVWSSIEPVIRRVAPAGSTRVAQLQLRAVAERIEGDFLFQLDDKADAALERYEKSIELVGPLHRLDPQRMDLVSTLARAHSRAVAVQFGLARIEESRSLSDEDVRLHRLLVADAKENARWLHGLQVAVAQRASIARFDKDQALSSTLLTEARGLAKRLFDLRPTDVSRQRVLAESLARLAEWNFDDGAGIGGANAAPAIAEAKKHWTESLEILQRVAREHPGRWGLTNRIERTEAHLRDCEKLLRGRTPGDARPGKDNR